MSSKSGPEGQIDPNRGYTIEGAAEALKRSVRWVRTHLVNTRECAYRKRGDLICFKGSWLIDWMCRDYEEPGLPEDNDSPPEEE